MSDAQSKMPANVPDWSQGVPLRAGEAVLGVVQPSPETVGFWQAIRRDELALKWCPACSKAFHPKRIVCTDCGAADLTWKASTGRGSVYSFSELHRAPHPAFQGSLPYFVGFVQLEEGVHFLSRLVPEPGPVAIDKPARVAFRVLETGIMFPVFLVG